MTPQTSYLSRSSCRRIGILSIAREISRTSQGNGLRSFTSPSLPTMASVKPRGRNRMRRADRATGSVSVITTTSRSTNWSTRDVSKAICSRNAGFAGLSAKTMIARACQMKSSRLISSASKTRVGSACHNSRGVESASLPSVAPAADAAQRHRIINRFSTLTGHLYGSYTLNICRNTEMRRGHLENPPKTENEVSR